MIQWARENLGWLVGVWCFGWLVALWFRRINERLAGKVTIRFNEPTPPALRGFRRRASRIWAPPPDECVRNCTRAWSWTPPRDVFVEANKNGMGC